MIFHRLGLILNREARRGVAPSKTPLPPRLRKERGIQGARLIHKNQRGFTLIELVIAIAITGLVTGGITMTIFQVFSGNTRTSNHMIAVRQVQNAGYWISHDGQMAQVISTEDNPNTPETEVLTLNWAGWEYDCGGSDTCNSSYEVRYTYDAVNKKLWRHEEINTTQYDSNGHLVNPQPDDQDSSTPVADHITSISTSMADNQLTVTITALVGDAVEERTYEITPRPSS